MPVGGSAFPLEGGESLPDNVEVDPGEHTDRLRGSNE